MSILDRPGDKFEDIAVSRRRSGAQIAAPIEGCCSDRPDALIEAVTRRCRNGTAGSRRLTVHCWLRQGRLGRARTGPLPGPML
jgi:hypothetical protein